MNEKLDRKQFIAGYLVEAEEHSRAANAHLLAIEATLGKGEPQPRRVRELFRAMHTLKGLSAMVGVDPVVDLAHELETILRVADQSAGRLSAPAVELLLRGVRAIDERVSAFAAGQAVPPAPQDLLEALSSLQPPSALAWTAPGRIGLEPALLAKLSPAEQTQLVQGVRQGRRVLRIEYVPSPAHSERGISITSVRERLAELVEIVKVIPVSVPKTERAPAALAFVLVVLTDLSSERLASASQLETKDVQAVSVQAEAPPVGVELAEAAEDSPSPLRTNSIRVDIARLDDAMENLSELVVTRFRLGRAVAKLREQGVDVRELSAIVQDNTRQLRALRSCITRARMVPVRELLERVPLIVRGMSRSSGKQVRLEIEAGNAEVDKAVGERVFPAIVHLVRNAVDHAIELPDERQARGKPEQGVVSVTCLEHSNRELELRVSDDGRGIDAKSVAAKAGRPLPKDDAELLELITVPGFSTLQHATSSSGRGMGMDIVKRIAVGALGGTLSMSTSEHGGTSFTLRIPLSISIVDSFAFTCGEEAFVVPVAMVEEVIEVDPARVLAPPAPWADARASIQLLERRGEAVPLLSLARLFSLSSTAPAPKALVVRRREQPFAFAVERMLGQQEIVVRPLEDPLVNVPGIAGTTDLGDGKPTLVLDLMALVSGDFGADAAARGALPGRQA